MKPGGQVPASGQDLAGDLLRAQSEHLLADAFGHDVDGLQAEHLDYRGDFLDHMSITPGGVSNTFSKGGTPTCH